jgi:hypothetical protein
LPDDAEFALYEVSTPVVFSRSLGVATAFDPDPRPFPWKSAVSFNSERVTEAEFLDGIKASSSWRSSGFRR